MLALPPTPMAKHWSLLDWLHPPGSQREIINADSVRSFLCLRGKASQ